jgi:nucleoside-diphosphate kinase
MQEQTLVIIKPDAVKRKLIGHILARFEDRGFAIARLKMLQMSEELVAKHYEEHIQKDFYPPLKKFILSGPVLVLILSGPHAIEVVRKMAGATNAIEAAPGTIRGDLSLSNRENMIHASDSLQSAEREIKLFFGD